MASPSQPHTHPMQLFLLLALLLPGIHGAIAFFERPGSIRDAPLWTINDKDGSVQLADNLNDNEAEKARKIVVTMLSRLYERDLLPFRTRNYARTKGVFDRVPLEKFMEYSSQHLKDVVHDNCLEWGPFFTRWPNVTQPYMKKFNCKTRWTFNHDPHRPRVSVFFNKNLYGELDHSLTEQKLEDVKNKFDLVIIPQTLQYVLDPHLSVSVLYELIKPGGHLVFSTPFMQTIMPYPTDYFRFTAEGNQMLLSKAGFEIVKSFVGGDDFWSLCWIMHCGVSDINQHMLDRALMETGGEYSRNSYMLSAQLARKPLVVGSGTGSKRRMTESVSEADMFGFALPVG